MKNFITISLCTIAAVFMTTSCLDLSKWEGNDPNNADAAAIVTIVDGSYDTNYYVEFDNGQKAFVTENKATNSFTFPSKPEQMRGELRKIIYFNYEDKKVDGYDMAIKILRIDDISTNLLMPITDESISKVIDKYTAPISISTATFGKNRNYITLDMFIERSEQDTYKHTVLLTYNKDKTGLHENVYGNSTDAESYLWLELYHDADYDSAVITDRIFTTYKLDTEEIGVKDLSNYRGIKIVYKNIDTEISEIYTINL